MTETPGKWTHRGIEITLLANGNFRSMLAGKPVLCNSLAAIKKRIDKEADDPSRFEPFKAYRLYGSDADRIEVIGTGTSKRRHHRRGPVFITRGEGRHSGEREEMSVVRSTPASDALFTELKAAIERNNAAKEKMEEEERDLVEKLEALEERAP